MVEPCVFIFLGTDESEKQKRIESFQKKLFPPGLKDLNYAILYGDEKHLSSQQFKEALSCFPTEGVKKRLVVIKAAHKLNKTYQSCLEEELQLNSGKIVVILDVPEVKGTESFVSEFSKLGAQVIRFKEEVSSNVFDLGRAIAAHKPDMALKILSGLLHNKEKSEKILGAIFWQWERLYSQNRLAQEAYKKGLKLISGADKKLKSSSSVYARETLILEALAVKLSLLKNSA